MITPTFSIIIPLYNKESTIKETLESVIFQDFENHEIIIIDDGSTDGSIKEIESLIEKYKITLLCQENSGVSASRNKGALIAKNQYLAFIDADDIWDNNHLKNLASLISKNPNAKIFSTNYIFRYPSGKKKTAIKENGARGMVNIWELAATQNFPLWTGAVAVEKQTFDKAGGFPLNVSIREDIYLWVKIATEFQYAFSPQATATYNKRAANSACDNKPQSLRDLAFFHLIKNLIKSEKICTSDSKFAKTYSNHCIRLIAIQFTTINFNRKMALQTLRHHNAVSLSEIGKFFFTLMLILLPGKLVRSLRIKIREVKNEN